MKISLLPLSARCLWISVGVCALAFMPAGCNHTDNVAALIGRLKDPDPLVRVRAVEALGKAGDARAIAPLVDTLTNSRAEPGDRESASMALSTIGSPAVDPLIATLKNADPEVRAGAAGALGRIRDPRAIPPLIAALNDSSSRAQDAASLALGKIGTPSVEALDAALRDPNPRVRMGAADAFGQNIDPHAVVLLTNALRDPDVRVRRHVAADMVKTGDDRMAAPLLDTLRDPDPEVRHICAAALIKRNDPGLLDMLIEALGKYGDKTMAEAYLNSGKPPLQQAAKNWAAAHNDKIIAGTGWKPRSEIVSKAK